jgi:hypothetical protein
MIKTMTDYTKAIEQIRSYLAHMLPFAGIRSSTVRREITVSVGAQSEVLSLSETMLEDLEEALNGGHSAKYVNGQIRDATLGPLIWLGQRGMAPHVVLSNQLINEDLDWDCQIKIDLELGSESAAILNGKLVALREVADRMLQSDVSLPDIQQERDIVDSLISFFEKHNHLNSRGVSSTSLSYVKAAAFLWIREMEASLRTEPSERVKAERSKKYFRLVEQFWLFSPFDRIPLPKLLRDFIAYESDSAPGGSTDDPGPSINVGVLLRRVDPRLEARWQGAWEALQSDNPDKVSQAANSMVEVLDQVISHTCQGRPFRDVLASRFPGQQDVIEKKRAYISSLKNTLHAVKHETNPQPPDLAEDLFHAAEGIIRTLLR